MKMPLALVCSLVVVALGFAQSTPGYSTPRADNTAPEETPKSPPTATEETPKTPPAKAPVRIVAPSKTTAEKEKAAKQAPKKKEEKKKEEPKIKGIVVPRGERGFLGVEMVNGAFKITFYDAKKKPVAPDVARAALRWDPKYKIGQERLVLNPDADGTSLSNPKTIRPPYVFKLFITLLKDASEKEEAVAETHVIDFRG